jgi:hypothetical protein
MDTNSIYTRLSVLLVFIFSFPATSQVPLTFQIAFGGADYDVSHMMMQVTNNGTYIFTGETYSFGAGQDDIYTTEISATGSILWSKTYGTFGSERSHCIRQTSDGGYIISGFKSVAGSGNDVCLIKTDATGTISWAKTYGGHFSEEAFSVRQTSDGGYILAGLTANFTSTVNTEMYIIKTDSLGNALWLNAYGVNGFLGDEARDILETPGQDFVVLGQTSTPGLTDVALLKIDGALGTVIWAKRYNFNNYDNAESFVFTPGGGIAIAGHHSNGANTDVFFFSTDSSGNVQWAKSYGDVYTNEGWGLCNTNDGGFALTGTWRAAAVTADDMFVMKTDAIGNVQFLKCMGSTKDDHGYIIHQTADSGFAVSGFTCCGGVGPGDRDFLLAKTDKQGEILGGCVFLTPSFTTTSPTVTGINMNININPFGISPNASLTTITAPTQNIVICNFIPLPVELIYFDAKSAEDFVDVEWKTASEINNDHFTVERSPDGISFESIAVVPGHGNSTETLFYTYRDETPVAGISYYRLKQTDYDGQFTYSDVVVVKRVMKDAFAIFPNPSAGAINIFYDLSDDSDKALLINDAVGKEIYYKDLNDNDNTISVENLLPGIYYVEIRNASAGVIKKLLIHN